MKELKIGDEIWFEEYPMRPFEIIKEIDNKHFLVVNENLEKCYKVEKVRIDRRIESNGWFSSKELVFHAKYNYHLNMATFFKQEQLLSISEFMIEDILERYNNPEYWSDEAIEEYNNITILEIPEVYIYIRENEDDIKLENFERDYFEDIELKKDTLYRLENNVPRAVKTRFAKVELDNILKKGNIYTIDQYYEKFEK